MPDTFISQPDCEPKCCDKCGIFTEFYVCNKTVTKETVLCSDCCRNFILHLIAFQLIVPQQLVNYATGKIGNAQT